MQNKGSLQTLNKTVSSNRKTYSWEYIGK